MTPFIEVSANELYEQAMDCAFVSFVDENYIDGFLALLRSLILNNPATCCDYVVLHAGLPEERFAQIRAIYPRVRPVDVDCAPYRAFTKGNRANYLYEKAYYILDLFKLRGYRKLIALDTDMVVLGDISELFDVEAPFAATPQYFDSDGGRKLNSGLLVVGEELLTGDIWQRILSIGSAGDYELEKHDQGILTALFEGDYERLEFRFNAVKRRFRSTELPDDVRILHFTGGLKPWVCTERGYKDLQQHWERYNLKAADFLARALEATSAAGNAALAAYYARRYWVSYGANPATLLRAFSAFRDLGRFDEWLAAAGDQWRRADRQEARLQRCMAVALRAVNGTADTLAELRGSLATQMGDGHALEELAQAFWTERDLTFARAAAEVVRAAKPFDRPARMMGRRLDLAEKLEAQAAAAPADAITHAAFYMTRHGNAGDIVLPASVRAALSHGRDVSWAPLHVHQRAGREVVDHINDRRGLVIGGGGLFLADTGANAASGWQWNIGLRELASIRVPIAVFAVGYNRFPGQADFPKSFAEHVELLIEKSCFFGLRNHGSIRALSEYISPELADRIEYQPCPTTVTRRLFPQFFSATARKSYVAINLAYDRPQLRFRNGYAEFLREIAHFIRTLGQQVEVRFFAHAVVDEQIVIDLAREEKLALPCDRLFELSEPEIYAKFCEPLLVAGMRGHAGMIPFGCGTPIISLVSHPKLHYFLEDVQMSEYAINTDNPGFGAEALALATKMLEQHTVEVEKVVQSGDRLWELTKANARRVIEYMY